MHARLGHSPGKGIEAQRLAVGAAVRQPQGVGRTQRSTKIGCGDRGRDCKRIDYLEQTQDCYRTHGAHYGGTLTKGLPRSMKRSLRCWSRERPMRVETWMSAGLPA